MSDLVVKILQQPKDETSTHSFLFFGPFHSSLHCSLLAIFFAFLPPRCRLLPSPITSLPVAFSHRFVVRCFLLPLLSLVALRLLSPSPSYHCRFRMSVNPSAPVLGANDTVLNPVCVNCEIMKI
jgi:hypothetical protein